MLLFREDEYYNSEINALRVLLENKDCEIKQLKDYIQSLELEISKHIELQNRLSKVIYVP